MHDKKITIIDYGRGNIHSIVSALNFLGATAIVTACHKEVSQADCLILPGVGSFRLAMKTLNDKGLDDAIKLSVNVKQTKMLGVCLGMQLLTSIGMEDGSTPGLNILRAKTVKFSFLRADFNSDGYVDVFASGPQWNDPMGMSNCQSGTHSMYFYLNNNGFGFVGSLADKCPKGEFFKLYEDQYGSKKVVSAGMQDSKVMYYELDGYNTTKTHVDSTDNMYGGGNNNVKTLTGGNFMGTFEVAVFWNQAQPSAIMYEPQGGGGGFFLF